MVDSTAKLREEILALSGVDIMENANEFKSTYKIMDELAAKWEDLTDIQQATITELIAGKRQGNIVSSLMSNFDTARDALETSLNSAGSAMAEHEKWQQSLEAQINKLKASWQGLSQAFLSSDFLKVAFDLIIKLVDGITLLIDKLGTLPTLLGAFAAFKGISAIFSTVGAVGGLKSFADILSVIARAFPNAAKGMGIFTTALKGGVGIVGILKAALQGLWTVVAAHPIFAVVAAVGLAITAFVKFGNNAEELAEKVGELTEKYKQNHEELRKLKGDYDTSNESSMISKYEKLSKGVDGLGRNISLTADEYSEYQNIVNQIAEQIPSLVSGYDSQGNALLSCKGNVEELTAAYEKLIHAQNQEILSRNNADIEKNWENTLKQSNGYDFWEAIGNYISYDGFFGGTTDDYDMKINTAEWFGSLTSDTSLKDIENYIGSASTVQKREMVQALQNAGYDVNLYTSESKFSKVLKNALEDEPEKIKGILDNYYAQFDEAVAQYKTKATALLSEAFDISSAISGLNYSNISEELQTIAYQTVNSLDFDFLNELTEQGKTVDQWTKELLNQLNTIGKAKGEYFKDAFELQSQFNGGDIDYGDYINKLREVESVIDKLSLKSKAKNQLKISLGLDENGVIDQYDALVNRLTSKEIGLDKTVAKNFLNNLSAEELSVAMDIIPKLNTGTTIDEIQSLIDEKLAEEFIFNIEVQTEGVEAFNKALAESRSAAGLTSESIEMLKSRYEDLEGFNAAALFEKTANGIRLNNEELGRLEEQYVATNKLEIDKNLSTLITKYNDITKEIKSCTDAQKKEELQAKADIYKDKIDELSTLASQYDGLTSAFTKWQNALNGAEEGDNYDSVFENLEAMKELDDKKLYGTDKYKTFAQLMSYEDLSTASIDKIGDAFDKGYKKAERYFTENKKGSTNFLNDLNKINYEWAHINKNGDWEVNINAEKAAKKLGISVDAVLLLLDKLKDYGIKVEVDDTSVSGLQTKIQETEAKLKELGQSPVDINVDIDASSANLGKIESEIEKAKNKIKEINSSSVDPKVKTAQLEDARAKLEALIQKKQEASQPAFMNLNTSQVNASLVDALDKIKEYQNALNDLNKLKELKDAGIGIDDSEIDSAQKKIDDCAKAIQGLDGDVKVAIGLEEDGSIDSIKKAFEEGKVKIDANTDPAVTKIEQLAENVERIEDKDVTINVTVNGLDQVKELNRQIDLATDIQGDIDKLSEYVENAKELNKLGGNIVTNITANVNGNVTETAEYKLNNLKVFGESAKHVKDVGSFTSKVTADVKGNVIETPEFKINNLKVFSDSANDLESIGSPTSVVTAEIKGNVTETAEFKLNNLKVFTDNAKDIGKIGNVESKVVANVDGDVTETAEYKLNNLKIFTDSASDIGKIGNVESKVVAEIEGNVVDTFEFKINNLKAFSDNAKELDSIGDVESKVLADVDGNVIETPEFKLNNLKVFSDNAKEIKDIGSFKSIVTAEIKGNVIDEFEYRIDNLKVFSDSAKNLESIGDVSSNVTANVNGNIVDTFEYKINNLKVFSDSAKDLNEIGNVTSNVVANVSGDVIETAEYKLNNLKVFADSAKDLKFVGSPTSNVTANIGGNVIDAKESNLNKIEIFADGANKLKNTGSPTSNVTANIDGNVIDIPEYKIDNLEIFADNAKELKGVGSFKSEVTANVKGNVIDEFEFKINNLGVFADNAKNLKEIGDVSSNVTANVDGNITDTFEYKINNLKVFSDSAKDLKNIGTVTSKVTADVDGNVIKTYETSIDNLKVFYDSAKDISKIGTVKSSVTADVGGNVIDTAEYKINNLKVFSDNAKDVKNVGSPTSNVTANVNGNVINTAEDKIDNLGVFATNANKLKNTGNFTSSVSANVSGNVITDSSVNSDLEHFASIVSGMSSQTVTVSVNANVDSADINNAIDMLTRVANSGVFKDYKATVQVGAKIATIDDATVQNYKAPPKEGKVKYSVDSESSVYTWTAPSKDGVVNYSASVEALTDAQKHKTGTITYKANIIGFGGVVNGTANANGSAFVNGTSGKAFKQGDWGVKKTTTALTGELGQELVVYKNRWYTVGDNGAEFATIPKGAIVFNHKQTEELFKNGKVTSDGGRGRALAAGTAFASGTAFADGTDFNESFDWIEVVISRLERAINNLEQTIDSSYKSWDSRENALTTKIGKLGEEITKQQEAKNYYSGKASGAYNDLSSYANNLGYGNDYLTKITSGIISVQDIKDEKLAEKVKAYQDWYEKALAAEDAVIELTSEKMDAYVKFFDDVVSEYDGILQGFDHTETMLDEYINQAEAQGHIVSKEYYDALKTNKQSEINKLIEEQSALIIERNKAEANGIDKNSQDWYNMCAEIDGVTQAIEEGTTALIEYDNAMRDIDWQVFDLIQERISDVTAEADFLIDLMSNDKLFDDNGKLTDKGTATIGLHGQNYNTYMYQSDEYGKEIADIDKQLAKGYNGVLYERRQELIEAQQESILAAEDEKNAVRDLVEEGINLELDALQERIDLHNEELDSMKDLYDYQKNVEEQTKNIASLQKQLHAYEGFDDEETRATVQKLKVELESAQQDLQETEYDKYIADQSALLDELFLEYETTLNTRLDDVDGLMSQVVDGINTAFGAEGGTITSALGAEGAIASALAANAASIGGTLKTEAEAVGTKLSTAMDDIWKVDGSGKAVLDLYGKDFQNKHTITNDALNSIKADVATMVGHISEDAQEKVEQPKTQPSSKADPTGGSSGGGSKGNGSSSGGNKSTGGDGKVKIGDKVKFLSGKYYYDSQGVNPAGSKNHGKYVYITNVNNKKWATHPIHISTGKKLGSGDLGWLKKNQISGYATGKKNFLDNEIAWTQENGKEFIVRPSDGAILTPIAKGDSILTSAASNNIWDMANSPADFIKDNLNLGSANVPNNSNVNNHTVQNFENIVFSMPNVRNYNEMLEQMQKDPKFDKLVKAISIDQIAGKSSLAKNKSIR